MASTIWKGQLTFGLVSFPVRLVKAARRERVALKYVREEKQDPDEHSHSVRDEQRGSLDDADLSPHNAGTTAPARAMTSDSPSPVVPVRQGYFSEDQRHPLSAAELQRGYEVAPDTFVVVRPAELRSLRKATSPDMQILRSVHMHEIDPVFLETSYYVVPGPGGEHSYGLFYRALTETQLAALAQVAMHGREHVVVVRPGPKGLIAHTMFYANEVRSTEEYAADTKDVSENELDLAKRFVGAIADAFRPEEFTDKYREQLEALIASKEAVPPVKIAAVGATNKSAKVVDIMDALRRSLETAKLANESRKPVGSAAAPEKKARKRKA